MKRNTIIVLLIVSLVLFSMIAIGSAEENSPCQDVDDDGVNDCETTSQTLRRHTQPQQSCGA